MKKMPFTHDEFLIVQRSGSQWTCAALPRLPGLGLSVIHSVPISCRHSSVLVRCFVPKVYVLLGIASLRDVSVLLFDLLNTSPVKKGIGRQQRVHLAHIDISSLP